MQTKSKDTKKRLSLLTWICIMFGTTACFHLFSMHEREVGRLETHVSTIAASIALRAGLTTELFGAMPRAEMLELATNEVDIAFLNVQIAQMRGVPTARLCGDARSFVETLGASSSNCSTNGICVVKMRDWRTPTEEMKSNVFNQVAKQLSSMHCTTDAIMERYRQVMAGLCRRTYVSFEKTGNSARVIGLAYVVSDNLRHCLLLGRSGNVEVALTRRTLPDGNAMVDSAYVYSDDGSLVALSVGAVGAKAYFRRDGKWMVSADQYLKSGLIDCVRAEMKELLSCE